MFPNYLSRLVYILICTEMPLSRECASGLRSRNTHQCRSLADTASSCSNFSRIPECKATVKLRSLESTDERVYMLIVYGSTILVRENAHVQSATKRAWSREGWGVRDPGYGTRGRYRMPTSSRPQVKGTSSGAKSLRAADDGGEKSGRTAAGKNECGEKAWGPGGVANV